MKAGSFVYEYREEFVSYTLPASAEETQVCDYGFFAWWKTTEDNMRRQKGRHDQEQVDFTYNRISIVHFQGFDPT